MKIGRNDPCPCGSGKKYKKCCLIKEREPQTMGSLYLPIEESLIDKVLLYHEQERFNWDYEEARRVWYDSFGTDGDGKAVEDVWFTVWFIHDYRLSYGKTLLELFYNEKRHTLGVLEKEIMEAWLQAGIGLYEVNSVKEGMGVGLTELHTGEKCFAYDISASQSLIKWDVILARRFKIRGINRLQGAALIFRSTAKEDLISHGDKLFKQYRKNKPGASWTEFMKEEGYRFNAIHGLLEKRAAETRLLTSEGDELEYAHAFYRVKDFNKASMGLERLEELLKVDEATGEDGGEPGVHYSWVTSLEGGNPGAELRDVGGTVVLTEVEDLDGFRFLSLGDIVITSEELLIECMSRQRLERGKDMLQGALGDSIEYLYSEYRDIDDELEEEEESARGQLDEMEDYVVPPEVSRRLTLESMESHYRKWVDTPISPLKGMTPREASKTREGRSMLEELLKMVENIELRRRRNEGVGYPVGKLRRELDMVEPSLGVIRPESFYSKESEKTKLNWLRYELALGIYDMIMEEEDKEFIRHIYDVETVAEFSVHLSKIIGGNLAKKPSHKVEKNYVMRAAKRFFPGMNRRVYDIMFKAVSEGVNEVLEMCKVCPTRCLYEKNAYCTMFEE